METLELGDLLAHLDWMDNQEYQDPRGMLEFLESKV